MIEHLLGLPELASANGAQMDRLMAYIHVLMAVLFVGWFGLFLYMLVRFRKGRNPKASYTGVRSHASRYAEIAVAVAEGVLLVGFSIPFWHWHADAFPADGQSVQVRVVAQQFAWNIHYPGPDGIFGKSDPKFVNEQSNPLGLDPDDPAGKDDITTTNQLHLPVGKPVIVHLSSKDVIHSFMLDEFRVKQDAIPGIYIPTHFTPTVTTAEMRERTGNPKFQYEIACAQLCGLGHYRMRGYLTIDTPEGFHQWLAQKEAEKKKEEEGGSFWQ